MPVELSRSLVEMLDEAIDVLTKFSVPLYVEDRHGRPEQYGTGFFVYAGGLHFLVSAAHVLDVARIRRVFYYISPDKLRTLTGRVLATGHPDRRDSDLLDVGVMRLHGDYLPPYPEVDKFPMDISYLKPDLLPRSGRHYVVVGFPATKSRIDTIAKAALASPYAYRSDPIDEAEYTTHGFNVETHVILPLDLRRGHGSDGGVRAFPKPQGMSGSPIVVLYDETPPETSFRVFPVVAIGTRYRKSAKILIGTDVSFALGAIQQLLKERPADLSR